MNTDDFEPRSDDRRQGSAGIGSDQIDQAMTRLQQALAFQLRAVRDHQKALANLDGWMGRLDRSCGHYHEALGTIDVEPLRQNSLKLVQTMDDFLRGEKGPDQVPPSSHAA